MGRLDALWMEMLEYEPFPEGREGASVLVCPDDALRELLVQAARTVERRHPDFLVTVKKEAPSGGGECLDLSGRIPAGLYGLTEEEAERQDSWEGYYRTLDEGGICAGDFLCQVFRLLAEDPGELPDGEFTAKISVKDGSYMVWKTVHSTDSFFYFDNTYDGRLKQLQRVQLDCLDEIDRICRKHKISYFLAGGTLLGAVRHQNILPWDDDIDVMMGRDEFERFEEAVARELGEKYFYQSSRTDPWFHSANSRILRRNTVFRTEFSSRFPKMRQGIFVDVFVQDRTAAGRLGRKFHAFLTLFARSLVFHKWEGTDMHFYGKWKGLCRVMTWFKNRSSMERLERIQERVITYFRGKKTGWLYDSTGYHLRSGAFPEEFLASGRMGILGDKAYPIPMEAERYLEVLYGEDYMRLPAPWLRKAKHPIVKLEFAWEG